MDPMVVSRSFATGVVTSGTGSAGGLIGRLRGVVINTVIAPSNPSTLVDVYSTGAVSGGSGVGGLIGQLESGATVTRAYSVGRVTGGGAGGLVGGAYLGCVGIEASCGISRISGVPTAVTPTSFWNTITSGQATSYGEIASGRTTTQLQTLGTYADAGWTIARGWSDPTATTWGICPSANGGYPFLQSQYTAAAQPCAGLPAVPRGVKATTGDGRVTVTWQAPASDGGSPITSYVATAVMQKASAKAAPSCSPAAGATSCTITGLRNGRAYRIALTAANIEGTGAAATVLATPRVGLIVLSTQRSGLAIVSKVRVVSAGRLTQVGTATGLSGKACRVTAQPKQAGVLMVRCPLTARAQQALIGGPLTVVSTLRFRPTSGTVRQAVRTVRFAQTDAAVTVTG